MVELHRFRLVSTNEEFEENRWYLAGYDAFHVGEPYNISTTNSDWRRGWDHAETGQVVKVGQDVIVS
jgi:hypothetical protein